MRGTRKVAARRAPAARARAAWVVDVGGKVARIAADLQTHHETGPVLSGGDLDADWMRGHLYGDEAVGGSAATPDQDMVDEIGRALGVEQDLDAELRSFDEIVRRRDRQRWVLEEDAAAEEDEG